MMHLSADVAASFARANMRPPAPEIRRRLRDRNQHLRHDVIGAVASLLADPSHSPATLARI